MSISLETLALARKYADKVAAGGTAAAVDKAIAKAVAESKLYTDAAIESLTGLEVSIVDILPTDNISSHTLYLLPMSSTKSGNDNYYEYLYINNSWELIGNTKIDLSDYYTKEEINKYLEDNQYVLPIASSTVVGGVKVDQKTILIDSAGTISLNTESVSEAAQGIVDSNFSSISSDEIANLF